jgi:hypothetical protein
MNLFNELMNDLNRICQSTSNMGTGRVINYVQGKRYDPPQIDLSETCYPKDQLGPACELAADNFFKLVIAVVNSDVNVDDFCKSLSALKYAVGTFNSSANYLKDFHLKPQYLQKVMRWGWWLGWQGCCPMQCQQSRPYCICVVETFGDVFLKLSRISG